MDIRSKNINETDKTDNEITELPKKKNGRRASRTVCFALSALLMGYIALSALIVISCRYRWDMSKAVAGDEQANVSGQPVYISGTEIESFYDRLCIAGAGFLARDTDELGYAYFNRLNDELWEQYSSDNDYVNIAVSNGYSLEIGSDSLYYYLSAGGQVYTNIDGLKKGGNVKDKLDSLGRRYFLRSGGKIVSGGSNTPDEPEAADDNNIVYVSQLTDEPDLSYGNTFIDPETGTAIFRFNYTYIVLYDKTNSSVYSVDVITQGELEEINRELAGSDGEYYYNTDELMYVIDGDTCGAYRLNSDGKAYVKLREFKQSADNMTVAIALGEKTEVNVAAIAREQVDISRFFTVSALGCGVLLAAIVLVLMARTGYDKDGQRYVAEGFLEKRVPTEVFLLSALAAYIAAVAATERFSQGVELPDLSHGIAALFTNDIAFHSTVLSEMTLYGFVGGVYTLLWLIGFGSVLVLIRKLRAHIFGSSSISGRYIKRALGFVKGQKKRADTFFAALPEDKWGVAKRFSVMTYVFVGITSLAVGVLGYIPFGGPAHPVRLAAVVLLLYAAALVWYLSTAVKYYTNVARLSDKIKSLSSAEEYRGAPVDESSVLYPAYRSLDEIDEAASRAAREMLKSEKTKIELVTNVSHDLKTPLTSIISYVYLLQKEDMSDEAKDYVRILSQKSEKLKAIVNDVFTLAKAAGGAEIKSEPLDLTMLINQTIASSQDIIDESGRRVRATLPEHPVIITGDGDKLSRVFQNLLDNALKYSMEGTRIYVDMSADGDSAEVVFRNISAEEMNFTAEEITERFARGDKSRTDGGSGLGLSIAKTFTEACGGEFRVELEGDMFKAIVEFGVVINS